MSIIHYRTLRANPLFFSSFFFSVFHLSCNKHVLYNRFLFRVSFGGGGHKRERRIQQKSASFALPSASASGCRLSGDTVLQ